VLRLCLLATLGDGVIDQGLLQNAIPSLGRDIAVISQVDVDERFVGIELAQQLKSVPVRNQVRP
jgi:hypothetical protein